jgi:hypothetical protein
MVNSFRIKLNGIDQKQTFYSKKQIPGEFGVKNETLIIMPDFCIFTIAVTIFGSVRHTKKINGK